MVIVDRIEEAYAVCESGNGPVTLPLAQLPEELREGDVLVCGPEGWRIDRQATDDRRAAMVRKSRRIFRRRDEASKEPL